jgi:hypothetical protein
MAILHPKFDAFTNGNSMRKTHPRATGALLTPRVQSRSLDLPVKQSNGDTAIHRIIENPVYGGAYLIGGHDPNMRRFET